MSADQVVFLGAASGVTLFVFGPGWRRALLARLRPEPLAPYRMPYGEATTAAPIHHQERTP